MKEKLRTNRNAGDVRVATMLAIVFKLIAHHQSETQSNCAAQTTPRRDSGSPPRSVVLVDQALARKEQAFCDVACAVGERALPETASHAAVGKAATASAIAAYEDVDDIQ